MDMEISEGMKTSGDETETPDKDTTDVSGISPSPDVTKEYER